MQNLKRYYCFIRISVPDDRWDRLQPPRNPTDGLSGYRKWMDGGRISAQCKFSRLMSHLCFYHARAIVSEFLTISLILFRCNHRTINAKLQKLHKGEMYKSASRDAIFSTLPSFFRSPTDIQAVKHSDIAKIKRANT